MTLAFSVKLDLYLIVVQDGVGEAFFNFECLERNFKTERGFKLAAFLDKCTILSSGAADSHEVSCTHAPSLHRLHVLESAENLFVVW